MEKVIHCQIYDIPLALQICKMTSRCQKQLSSDETPGRLNSSVVNSPASPNSLVMKGNLDPPCDELTGDSLLLTPR